MKSRGKMHVILIVVIALIGGAVGAVVSYGAVRKAGRGSGGEHGDEPKPKPVSFVYSLGEITVNLNQPGRYLQVAIDLEVTAYATAEEPAGEGEKHSAAHGEPASAGIVLVGGHGAETEEDALPPLAAAAKSEMDTKRPKIMDCVIEVLSSASFDEVLLPQGKRDLRDRIRESVNAFIEKGEVKQVYFTSFLAQ